LTAAASAIRYRLAPPVPDHRRMEPAHDDRSLFERLCLLRALYARRGDRDRLGVTSLLEAMRHAEVLLARSEPSATPSA
jgi:hypothetical protein